MDDIRKRLVTRRSKGHRRPVRAVIAVVLAAILVMGALPGSVAGQLTGGKGGEVTTNSINVNQVIDVIDDTFPSGGGSRSGTLAAGDNDWFLFCGRVGDVVTITNTGGSLQDPFLTLVQVDDGNAEVGDQVGVELTLLALNDDFIGLDSQLTSTLPATTQYAIIAGSFQTSGSGTYTVTLSGNTGSCNPHTNILDGVAALEGKLDTNLDARVGSRASQASVDALEAKLDALASGGGGASLDQEFDGPGSLSAEITQVSDQGQTFTVGLGGLLTEVQVKVQRFFSATAPLLVDIRRTTGGGSYRGRFRHASERRSAGC